MADKPQRPIPPPLARTTVVPSPIPSHGSASAASDSAFPPQTPAFNRAAFDATTDGWDLPELAVPPSPTPRVQREDSLTPRQVAMVKRLQLERDDSAPRTGQMPVAVMDPPIGGPAPDLMRRQYNLPFTIGALAAIVVLLAIALLAAVR